MCKLNKVLYRLKQSSRLWYKHLKDVLLKLGFITLPYDEGVFIYLKFQIILCCYVDDFIAAGFTNDLIRKVINIASKYIKLQEMGKPLIFLGIEMEFIKG